MESIAIVLAAVAIIWLIVWCIRNENAPSIGEQKGLFRMVDHSVQSADDEEEPPAKSDAEISGNERR
jgi:hypothetical protein